MGARSNNDEPQAARDRGLPATRDEVVLVVDLYERLGGRMPAFDEPDLVDVHSLLQGTRNLNAIRFRIAALMRLDKATGRKGLQGSKLLREVWDEHQSDPARIRREAEEIRRHLERGGRIGEGRGPTKPPGSPAADDHDFSEGSVKFREHRERERNRSLVTRKKEAARREHGCLACEVCGFNFGQTYGTYATDYIECHHIHPISESVEGRRTKLADLALVCGNCHRVLHLRRPWLTPAELRGLLATRRTTESAPVSSGRRRHPRR